MFDKALAEKEKKGEGNDKDAADFLYNQACYYCKIAENETEQVAKEQNFQKTLEVLSKSCQISTSNKIDAQKDPDFSSVRDENQGEITLKFKRIVGV